MCAVTLGNEESDGATPQLLLGDRPLEFSELSFDYESYQRSHTSDVLLLVGVIRDISGYGKPIRGLVLQPTGLKNGEYIRVGYWAVSLEEENNYDLIKEEFYSMSLDPSQFEAKSVRLHVYRINII
jgi:hypothetical protein